MPYYADRIKETSTSSGTGSMSLGGAVANHRAFSDAFISGQTVYYEIEGGTTGEWETGLGTLTSGTPWTLARTTVLSSSAGGTTKTNFSAGTQTIFCTVPAFVFNALDSTPADIRALAMMVSELKGDRISMPDGIFDPIADTSDIGTTTNGDTSVAGKITGTINYGSNLATSGQAIGTAASAGSSGQVFDGTTSGSNGWVSNTTGGSWNGVDYLGQNFGSAKHIRRFKIVNAFNGDTTYGITSVKVQYSDNGSSWTDHSTVSITASASLLTYDLAASGAHQYWRLLANSGANGANRWGCAEIEFYEQSGLNNMTLISNSFTAAAQPSKARLVVQAKPIDSITINTDLVGYVSRDGGTTFTTATLALETTLADGTKLYVQDGIDISGQPSGTSMKWKVTTANNKNVEVNGIGLRWAA